MMGKGKGRHVVRNKVVLVNLCCVVSDPTSYNYQLQYIGIKLFGEEHEGTADSYGSLGVTQHEIHDYKQLVILTSVHLL